MCCRGGEVPRWLGSHGVVGQGDVPPATEALAAAATRWSWSRQTSDAAVGAFAAAVVRWSWSCRRRQLGHDDGDCIVVVVRWSCMRPLRCGGGAVLQFSSGLFVCYCSGAGGRGVVCRHCKSKLLLLIFFGCYIGKFVESYWNLIFPNYQYQFQGLLS